MAASLEETLISVWREVMVEGLKPSRWKAGIFPCGGRAGPSCAKWISALTLTNCVDSSKILEPVLDGRDWHGKEKRSCSFSADDATSPLWRMERCSSGESGGWMNWNARCRGAH